MKLSTCPADYWWSTLCLRNLRFIAESEQATCGIRLLLSLSLRAAAAMGNRRPLCYSCRGSDATNTPGCRAMQKVVAAALAIGTALLVGGLVQVYYSGLPAESTWGAPALYSSLAVILFSIGLWLFAWH